MDTTELSLEPLQVEGTDRVDLLEDVPVDILVARWVSLRAFINPSVLEGKGIHKESKLDLWDCWVLTFELKGSEELIENGSFFWRDVWAEVVDTEQNTDG